MSMEETELPPEAELQLYIFKKSVPLQTELQEIVRALGGTDGLTCLDVGSDNGMFSYQLRKEGGTWRTVVSNEEHAIGARAIVGDGVQVLTDGKLPFEKKTFDIAVVTGQLERMVSDEAFIEECHRVLKPDGRLVLCVSHFKTFSLMRFLRRMAGLSLDRRGLQRFGYTESQLFRILKNGFDVHHMRTYSRFFVELVRTFVTLFETRKRVGDSRRAVRRAYQMAYPFYRLAYQLDMLLLFTRGFRCIAVAKRRVWLPRNAPVLVDGRSISEAVLSKALD